MNLNLVLNFLKEFLQKNDTIVIGVSGGSDSMCLLQLLIDLKEDYHLKLICAHVNHGKRKESEEEKEFVENFCQKNNCIFEYQKLNFKNEKNFENQAREKRYAFYNTLIEKYQANYLMTAHHGDDLIETVLMRLTRGSNVHGYSGFAIVTEYQNYKLVRPLIFATKEEIEEYNRINKIEYRIDKTNESDAYTRNRYRHHLLPFLKEENKNIHKKFLRFSEELSLIDEYLEKQTKIALTSVYDFGTVNLHEFKKLDLVLQRRVIEYALKEEYKNNIHFVNDCHVKLILDLCHSNKPNLKLNLPLKRILQKSYEKVFFSYIHDMKSQEYILEENVKLNELESIIKIDATNILKSNYILRLDSKEIALPLKVRKRKSSDRMHIKNMQGTKKVKDIFINEKIPMEKRDTWPVVIDANDNILWLPGLKKSNFDKNKDEFYDIIYKYVISEEKKNEEK